VQVGLHLAAAAGAARPAGRQLEAASANSADSSKDRDKCSPSLLDVAKEQGQLRQLVALAAAGYDLFAVDGGKPFTALAPSDRALKQLAAGAPRVASGRAKRYLQPLQCIQGAVAASSALQACHAQKPLRVPSRPGARSRRPPAGAPDLRACTRTCTAVLLQASRMRTSGCCWRMGCTASFCTTKCLRSE
jgi:hypothetical protein